MKRQQIRDRILKNLRTAPKTNPEAPKAPAVGRRQRTVTLYS